MIVGVLRLRLDVYAGSLKEKRASVRSLVDRIRARFNAAVAETGDLDALDRATIAVVCVSNDAKHVDRMLQEIASFAGRQRLDAEIADIATELIHT